MVVEPANLRTALDYTHEMAAQLAKPADMSWPVWAAHHWVASILAYGAFCNVLVFYYLEKDRWLRRATTLPHAAEARPEVVRSYLAAVLARSGGASKSDAAGFVEQWPFSSMKDTEEAEVAWFQTVFGERRGALLHQRVRADVARRRSSPARDLSSESFFPASVLFIVAIKCFLCVN